MKANVHLNKFYFLFLLVLITANLSCRKYLDKKPVKTLVTPKKLSDLQALLDNHGQMNENSFELPETFSDNYYMNSADWAATDEIERANYLWDKDATHFGTWVAAYLTSIYHSNVVLDELPNIEYAANEKPV
jgi:starch-binding outer membrane protein, SusD/RagB family